MSQPVREISEPAIRRLDDALAGSPHGAAWAAEADRLGLRVDGGAAYFGHPMALPVLQLPGWAAPEAPPRARAHAEDAALTGYLYARLRDDALDLGHAPAPTRALASWLHAAHLRAVEVVGGAAVLARAHAAWAAFDRAMADEAARHPTLDWDAAAFDRSLDRLRPLGLPVAALTGGAPSPAHAALEPLIRAHQLHIDLTDLEDDAAAGRSSHVLVRAGGWSAADRGRVLFLEGGLDALLDEIRAELAAAAVWPALRPWAEARRARVDETGQRAWKAFFRVVAAALSPG